MNVRELLSRRIHMPEVKSVVSWAAGSRENIAALWRLARTEDRMTSVNALWTMTNLPGNDAETVVSLRGEMIDMLLVEADTGKKRMLLQLLRSREWGADDLRTDFLDYCLSKINSECESYAVRCYSLYLAYDMCRHFPELTAELQQQLELMHYQPLSPGLKSALRQVESKITKRSGLVKRSHNAPAPGINDLHTTRLGAERIRRNLHLDDRTDVASYCEKLILAADATHERKGKNWYVTAGNVRFTVNAASKTIITAHLI